MTNLTLIIPAKKEKESLPKVLQNLKNYNYKVIVSLQKNDVETINSIKNFDVMIHQQTGVGYGNSITEGINSCSTKYFCITLLKFISHINNFNFRYYSTRYSFFHSQHP